MSKLEKPVLFIVIPVGYQFPIRVYADWETESSFGVRGYTFNAVRYNRSTGSMYKKNSCAWRKFEDESEGEKVFEELLEFSKKIDRLNQEIFDEIANMKKHLSGK